MNALPSPMLVVMRDVARSYPLPVTVENGVRITTDGESFAEVRIPQDRPFADQIAETADQIADWLVEQLPAGGHSAVWPACPIHPATHPLTAHSDGREAVWVCPATGQTVAAVGELA